VIGFVMPMPRSRRGRATVRTRSGRVVNQWLIAVIVWAMVLGPPGAAMWWAHVRGVPDVWLVGIGVFMAIWAIALAFVMIVVLVSSVRRLRGHPAREPWFTTTWEHEDVDPYSWKIPKLW